MKMEKIIVAGVALLAAQASFAAGTLKAAWFTQDISCKVGSLLAGYGSQDVSVAKYDDLQLHGLALDDGIQDVGFALEVCVDSASALV